MGWLAFPAASRHCHTSFAGFASGPLYETGGEHSFTPDAPSVPVKPTSTGWLYQPFTSGGREGAAVTPGGLLSYLFVMDDDAELPALSVHDPDSVTAPPSGPPYVPPPEQPASPDAPSPPAKPNSTGFVYQPSTSGSRYTVPPMLGGDESFLTVTLADTDPPGYVTVQVNVAPSVSLETVAAAQPPSGVPPGSNDQPTLTLPLYQSPLQPPPLQLADGKLTAAASPGQSATTRPTSNTRKP